MDVYVALILQHREQQETVTDSKVKQYQLEGFRNRVRS